MHAAYRDLHLRLVSDADLSWQQKRTSGDRVTRDISFWDLFSFSFSGSLVNNAATFEISSDKPTSGGRHVPQQRRPDQF